MDLAMTHQLAEAFRSMSVDELALFYADIDRMEPEAKQALLDVVAAHPSGDHVKMRAAKHNRPKSSSLSFALELLKRLRTRAWTKIKTSQ